MERKGKLKSGANLLDSEEEECPETGDLVLCREAEDEGSEFKKNRRNCGNSAIVEIDGKFHHTMVDNRKKTQIK